MCIEQFARKAHGTRTQYHIRIAMQTTYIYSFNVSVGRSWLELRVCATSTQHIHPHHIVVYNTGGRFNVARFNAKL